MKQQLSILVICLSIFSFKPKPVKWAAIGDSITYLNDHPEETGNRVSKGYLSRVTMELRSFTYINKGYNGWTAWAIAGRFNSLEMPKADIYTVFLGTNDWWLGKPVGKIENYTNNDGNSTFFGSYRIILDRIKSINPDAKIILITPMQRVDFVYIADPNNNAYGSYKTKSGQFLEEFATAVSAIAANEHIPIVDLYHDKALQAKNLVKFKKMKIPGTDKYQNYTYPASISVPYDAKHDEYPYPTDAMKMTYDGLHPSDKGNEVIAKRLIRAFKQME